MTRLRASTRTTPMTPDGAVATLDAGEVRAAQRLHPMSWLFVLLQQLRQFVVPLVALVVFGQGDRDELWPLIGVAVLVVASVWQYATYRYGIGGDRLVVRSGLLQRSLRVIPFARIHNVTVQQNALHRLFDVAEVRLESAGGTRPEAQMRVLRLADALALDALVRHRGPAPDGAVASAEPAGTVLLHLPLGELLRLGLVSNRGLIVVGAGVAGVSQFQPRLLSRIGEPVVQSMSGYARAHTFGTLDYALAAVALFALAVAVLRLLSIALALLQFHGYTLRQDGRRLSVVRGLLGRVRTSAPRRRIQAWTLREGVLHRLLRRRSLDVDVAGGGTPGDGREHARPLKELAPIATPDACDALVRHLLPQAGWPGFDWHGVATRNAWRLFLPSLAWNLTLAALLVFRFDTWALLVLAWLPWSAYAAWRQVHHMGWACNDQVLVVRDGWWSRTWRMAEIDKLHVLHLRESPVDRLFGTATLFADTTGGSAMGGGVRLRWLPAAQARTLRDALVQRLSRSAIPA